MKRLLRSMFICLCIILLSKSIYATAASLFDPSTIYNSSHVSPLKSYFEHNNERVDPSSGALTITHTDFVLPGRNGLDLVFTRRYQSNLTGLGLPVIYEDEDYWAYWPGGGFSGEEVIFEDTHYMIRYGYDWDEWYPPQSAQVGKITGEREERYWYEEWGVREYDDPPITMSVEMEYRTCCILRTTIVEDTNYTEKYWFGSGWTLAFPFIEEHDMGAYLFHEDGQVFEFDWYSGKFQSYGLKDLQINTNDSPIINGVTVYYTLTYKGWFCHIKRRPPWFPQEPSFAD